MDNISEISGRIIKIIEKSSISLESAAKKCGIPPSTMRSYKNGTNINLQNAIAFIDTFDVNPDYLLFGKSPMFRHDLPQESTSQPTPVTYGSDAAYTPRPASEPSQISEVDELRKKLEEAEKRIDTLTQTTNIQAATIAALVNKKQ